MEPISGDFCFPVGSRSAGEGAHMDADQGRQRVAGAITIEREATDRWVLYLRGDVDTAVATRFTSSQGRQRVVVDAIDAGDVTFISSSGLALMLLCVEASVAAGRHPLLRAASRPVDRALQLSGIEAAFPRPEPGEPPPEPEGGPAEPE
jgi:anti-anti-sigma regulatory factor